MYEKTVLSDEQKALMIKIDAKVSDIQSKLNVTNIELQKAMETVNAVRDRIRPLRKELTPLAEMKAGIASAKSRDKYFPDLSKNAFIEMVKGEI